jgi:hypothetical protein
MRYLPMILGAALVSVGLPTASGKAHAAMPVASPDRSAVPASLIEKAGCYYRHYELYRPYGYYRPYRYYGLVRSPLPLALVGDA